MITIWIRIDSTQSLQKLWTTLWSNFWYDFWSKTLLNRLDQFLMELNFKRTLFLNLQLIWELNFDQNRFNSVSSKTLNKNQFKTLIRVENWNLFKTLNWTENWNLFKILNLFLIRLLIRVENWNLFKILRTDSTQSFPKTLNHNLNKDL